MQSHGSLAETPLRSLMESAQGERSTGTLTIRNGNGQSTSLYFLFGHLFHAQGDGRSGDDAVVSATLSVKDPFNTPTTTVAQVTVSNAAPSLGALTAPTGQVPLANAVDISGAFTDAGAHDTHVASELVAITLSSLTDGVDGTVS